MHHQQCTDIHIHSFIHRSETGTQYNSVRQINASTIFRYMMDLGFWYQLIYASLRPVTSARLLVPRHQLLPILFVQCDVSFSSTAPTVNETIYLFVVVIHDPGRILLSTFLRTSSICLESYKFDNDILCVHRNLCLLCYILLCYDLVCTFFRISTKWNPYVPSNLPFFEHTRNNLSILFCVLQQRIAFSSNIILAHRYPIILCNFFYESFI